MPSSNSPGNIYSETLAIFDQRDDPYEPLTTPEVADALDAARRTVYKRLEKLVSRGELKTKKAGANARVWWRPIDESSKRAHTSNTEPERSGVEPTVAAVLERITDGFYGLDDQFRLTYVNNRAEDLLDLEASAVLGRDIHDELPLTEKFETALQEAYETQEPVFIEDNYDPLSAWFENAIYPSETGLSVYFRDISTRKRREHALEKYETIVETFGDGIFTVNATNQFSMVNEAYADMLGYTRDELIGTPASRVASVEDYTEGEGLKAELNTVGDVAQHELELETKTGETVPVEVRFSLLPSAKGEESGVVAIVRDITKRKAQEQSLHDAKLRLEAATEAGAVGTWEFKIPEDRIVTDRWFAKIFGVDPNAAADGVSLNQFTSAIHEDDRERVLRKIQEASDSCGDYEAEYRVHDVDGELRWVVARGHVECDDQGNPVRFPGAVIDITDRKHAEEKLRENEAWLSDILEQLPAAVGVFDTDGDFRLQNDRMRKLAMGNRIPSKNPETGGNWIGVDEDGEQLPPEQWPGARALRGEAVSPGIEFRFEDDDETRWMDVTAMPVSESEGGTEVSVVIQDITDRKERERQLEVSRNRYRTLIENFPNGAVALVDEDLRFVTVSPPTVEEGPATGADLTGKTVAEALPPEMADLLVPRYTDALNGEHSTFEAEVGDQVYQLRVAPVRNDSGHVFGAMAVSQDITERKRHEEDLTALNQLNQVFQGVTNAVIESSSREEIEETITEQLTNSDSYEYAWIGHLDRHGENIIPQTAETDEASLSEIALSTETGDSTSFRTVAEAIRTGAVQVAYDSPADPVFKQWDQSTEGDQKSVASIPIIFEARVYGVLTVYTGRENAFDENERRIIERLGEVVGHAINAIERKRALQENRVQEITFRSRRFAEVFTEAADDDSFTLSIEKFVVLPDDQSITYYSLDGLEPAAFVDIIEQSNPNAECHVIDEDGSQARVEVQGSDLTLAAELVKYNSWIVDGNLQNGEFRLRVQVPKHSDVREVKNVVKEEYPDVEVLAQTEVERESARLSDVFSDLDNQLTDRQRTTLEVAYYSGYFDWPRAITGGELAKRLDVTQGTISHHIRHGERKLVSAFFDSTA